MSAETITQDTLRELLAAGAIHEAVALADGSRWSLVVRYGGIERVLAARRSRKPRSWAHLDSLVRYLGELGIRQFSTDARNYDPSQPGQKRPDRAKALRQAHEAAEYDRWFREQVQEALDDPRPSIPHEEAMARMEAWLTERYGPRPDKL